MTKARSNATANAAKGDLTVGNGTNLSGILAVGNNGETIVADSSTATGLRYQAPVNSNPVLNSAFQIWQRGTSIVGTGGVIYTADRWSTQASSAFTISRQATGDTTNLPFIQYCARFQRNVGSTNTTAYSFVQSFETVNSIPFAGKTVTMSFYARKGANYSGASSILYSYLLSGTGTDQNYQNSYTGTAFAIGSSASTLTTTWQRFTYTGTVAATATELTTYFEYTGVGTAGAADYFEITGVQIEVGSVATPFKTNAGTIQGELAACQRYYEKTYDITTAPGTNTTTGAFYVTQSSDNGANSVYNTRFKVEKRNTSYAIAYYTTAGTATKWQYARSGVALTDAVITNLYSGTSGLSAYTSVGAIWTNNQLVGHWVVDNEL